MTSFQDLRQRRHAHWLTDLKQQIQSIVKTQTKPPRQVYLFGSRARGDWDGLSDTDLLVVADSRQEAEQWAELLLDGGLAQDVIGLDQESWQDLANHPSVIWRHVAQDAQPLLEAET